MSWWVGGQVGWMVGRRDGQTDRLQIDRYCILAARHETIVVVQIYMDLKGKST